MQKINSDLYLIDQTTLTKLLQQPPLNPDLYFKNQKTGSLKGNIIIHPDELLDLMQESIEHSHCTLPREKAADLLKAKGIV